MKIFVTGATGFVGSAVVKELLNEGHEVSGLARSDASAASLMKIGAKVVRGDLENLDALRRGASESDGVVHTAFIHGLPQLSSSMKVRLFAGFINGGPVKSFTRILETTETRAIHAMGSALVGSGRPLVVTSGILALPQSRISKETDIHVKGLMSRAFSEAATLAFVSQGVKASIVRLSPTVHGPGDHGFVPQLIQAAKKKNASPYVEDGSNRWTAVNRLDAARLFRLAVEQGMPGAIYHAVDETSIPFREIAEFIGKKLNVPAVSIARNQTAKHFGFLSPFVGLDNPSSSEWTRHSLGWKPDQSRLFQDLESAGYFS